MKGTPTQRSNDDPASAVEVFDFETHGYGSVTKCKFAEMIEYTQKYPVRSDQLSPAPASGPFEELQGHIPRPKRHARSALSRLSVARLDIVAHL